MITRNELLNSKEYWLAHWQGELFRNVSEYLDTNKISKVKFAEKLGYTKGYISQILNGDFDHKLSKFIELSLAVGKVPVLKFEDLQTYIESDAYEAGEQKKNLFYINPQPNLRSSSNTIHAENQKQLSEAA
jgi:transcriptional regulator with XRE-family HTH domain